MCHTLGLAGQSVPLVELRQTERLLTRASPLFFCSGVVIADSSLRSGSLITGDTSNTRYENHSFLKALLLSATATA